MSGNRNVKMSVSFEMTDTNGEPKSDWGMNINYYDLSPQEANQIEQAALTPLDTLKVYGLAVYGNIPLKVGVDETSPALSARMKK